MKRIILAIGMLLGVLTLAALPRTGAAQDVMSIGTGSGARGSVVEVPIYIKDVEGTPLGAEYVFGQNIQGFAFQIQYEPAAAVASIACERSGATTTLSAPFETRRATANTISYVLSSKEGAQRLSGLNGTGGVVARLLVQIAATAQPASTITLKFTAAKTMLSNTAGTLLETTANGGLALVNGAVSVSNAAVGTSISIAVGRAKGAEKGRKAATIILTRTGDLSTTLQVKLRIKGSAKNGIDYVRLPATVTFKRGQARLALKIKPIDDRLKEKAETVLISLKGSPRYSVATLEAVRISIADND